MSMLIQSSSCADRRILSSPLARLLAGRLPAWSLRASFEDCVRPERSHADLSRIDYGHFGPIPFIALEPAG